MITDGETIIYRSNGFRTVRTLPPHPVRAAGSFGVRSAFVDDRIRQLEARVAALEKRLAELAERNRPRSESDDLPVPVPRREKAFPGELKVALYSGQGATAVVGPARIRMEESGR